MCSDRQTQSEMRFSTCPLRCAVAVIPLTRRQVALPYLVSRDQRTGHCARAGHNKRGVRSDRCIANRSDSIKVKIRQFRPARAPPALNKRSPSSKVLGLEALLSLM